MKKNRAPAEQVAEVKEPPRGPTLGEVPGNQAAFTNVSKNKVSKISRTFTKVTALLQKDKKRAAIVVLLILLVLLVAPFTRYKALGLFIKKPISIKILDSKTGTPISEASVNIKGQVAKTNSNGIAEFKHVRIGKAQINVTKRYYKTLSFDAFIGLRTTPLIERQFVAQGRPVKVKATNKISGAPIENIIIKVEGEEYKTGNTGEAQIVIPGNATEVSAVLTGNGFNQLDARITAIESEQADERNVFALIPSGKVLFLSKRTGKIDVMKSNLDGSEAEVVLAGTGKEFDNDTILLASRDWKYATLKARRDSDKAKLYLIEADSGKATVIDEGNAEFTLTGWYNEFFVFQVQRYGLSSWEPKRHALKSFNAKTSRLRTLDETNAQSVSSYEYAEESISNVYILENRILYTRFWGCPYYLYGSQPCIGKESQIVSVRPDGSEKRNIKGFTIQGNLAGQHPKATAQLYAPQELYFEVSQSGTVKYFEFEDGKIEEKNISSAEFYKFYPTFLLSPSGAKTFWYEPRDGKNTLFVGNSNGENGKEIGSLTEYVPYGWYSDDYLFVSKNSSEIYIIPAGGIQDPDGIIKVTDYHKPTYDFRGYGYGYGGF